MTLFKDKREGGYEVIREGEEITIRLDYEGFSVVPSIEDSAVIMGKIIDILVEVGAATRIVFMQKRDYEYDYKQVLLLSEIASLFKKLTKQNITYGAFVKESARQFMGLKYVELKDIIYNLLKSDPLGAYMELVRLERREKILYEQLNNRVQKQEIEQYRNQIEMILQELENTKLLQVAKPYLAGYKLGDREAYRKIFSPLIKPDFMFTKLLSAYPKEGEELANYNVGKSEVTIFSIPNSVQTKYHLMPPEFRLEEDKYELLDDARRIMAEHKPKRSEFIDPKRMREVFYRVGQDLLEELANYHKMKLSSDELEELTQILIRYTVGFGLVEILLQDTKIQDISVNSPLGSIPIFVVHEQFEDCVTNIIPTLSEAESWASKLRMISGRPLDEANPLLDTELELPGASTRISVITQPLDPTGMAYSFRRHRDKPWTLPLFIKVGMIDPLAAGLISFLVDGTRTMFICGTRSSGKTSLLSSVLLEISRRSRIITVEDTLELPFNPLKKLGYNIVQMKVASQIGQVKSNEFTATDGIRSTLRLGDSSLIVGEVRSKEAIALFEAMRVGAGANVVAGTFHADNPFGVYDRCVNAIGIPKTSFKALDCCIIANPLKSADGLHKVRRVTEITEVRKHWQDDPLLEGGFSSLMKYDTKTDKLQPTDALINGESEIIKTIAGNVKEWATNWDAVWENIVLRGRTKELLVKEAMAINRPDLLEAEFSLLCTDVFHRITGKVVEEVGGIDTERVYQEYQSWLKRELKKKQIEQNKGGWL